MAEGPFPVILASHGLGGNVGALGWLTAGLAEAGALVISVNHPNSTTRDFDLQEGLKHWTRTQDLRAALDWLAARRNLRRKPTSHGSMRSASPPAAGRRLPSGACAPTSKAMRDPASLSLAVRRPRRLPCEPIRARMGSRTASAPWPPSMARRYGLDPCGRLGGEGAADRARQCEYPADADRFQGRGAGSPSMCRRRDRGNGSGGAIEGSGDPGADLRSGRRPAGHGAALHKRIVDRIAARLFLGEGASAN